MATIFNKFFLKFFHAKALSIEGNTLSIDQVTAVLEGKRVIGPSKDILEVQNAFSLYKQLDTLDPLNINDLLQAHDILMKNLIKESGIWRSGNVGILKGDIVSHVAPPAKMVPIHMENLFTFLKNDNDLSWLIKACIFHYELEFVHPFTDGNGRIGRFWQQLILMKEDPVFEFIPIEVLIKSNQAKYYDVLEQCDKKGESTLFIEFSCDMIHRALIDYGENTPHLPQDVSTRLLYAKKKLQPIWFSRKDYLKLHPHISTATASRDLSWAIKKGYLKRQGEKNQIQYSFENMLLF